MYINYNLESLKFINATVIITVAFNFKNHIHIQMKNLKLILIILLMLVSKISSSQTPHRIEKNKIEISIKLEGTKRKSDKYFDSDTNTYTLEQRDPEKYYKNNNYLAGSIGIKKYYPKHYILSSEFRYKLWGFKEYFLTPYKGSGSAISYGFSSTVFNIDLSVSLLKRIEFYKRFELRPRIGLTLFYPFTKGFDSTVYYNFGNTEFNNYYLGNTLKLGMNIGLELNYKITNRIAFTTSFIYYTPFNNNFGWTHAERVVGTQYPWRKYRKKNDGLYLGFGVNYSLRRLFND